MAGNNNATYKQGLLALIFSPFKFVFTWLVLLPLIIISTKLCIALFYSWYDDKTTYTSIGDAVYASAKEDLTAAQKLQTFSSQFGRTQNSLPHCPAITSQVKYPCRTYFLNAGERGEYWANRVHDWFWVKTGIWKMMIDPQDDSQDALMKDPFRRVAENTVKSMSSTLETTAILMSSVVIRLAILLSLIPTVLLIFIPALIDGYVARKVRQAKGAGESSAIYHRAKQWSLQSLSTPALLIAVGAFPILNETSLAITFVFLCFVGYMVRTWIAYFKKYI